jgi:hypothetical protein
MNGEGNKPKTGRGKQTVFTILLFIVALINVAKGNLLLAALFGLGAVGALYSLLKMEE